MKKIILCNCPGNACQGLGAPWMLSCFAAGIFYIFYFWLCNGKNYKMYFSSWKELENLF